MRTVDVHHHFIPPALVEEARAGRGFDGVAVTGTGGREWIEYRQGSRFPLPRHWYDLDARLAGMDGVGIDEAVLSISPTLYFYYADAAATAEFTRMANESMADAAARSGGRLHAIATLPMQDPAAAVAELEHAVGTLGMRGAEIGTTVGDVPLDDPRVYDVLATAERLGVPVVLHEGHVGPRPPLEDYSLVNFIGNPLETTLAVSRLIFSGVLDRLPRLQLVLVHAGGYLPYQIGRLDHGFRVRPAGLHCAMPPSAYLGRFLFDTVTHLPAALGFLVALVGADRVAFGTDFPYDMSGGPLHHQLRGLGLGVTDREAIAGGNAARTFGLPAADRDGAPVVTPAGTR